MFIVHTRPGDFEADTTDEVLDLFAQYPFIAGDDFFTVSRSGIDYLEIFKFKHGFTLAYIPPNEDRSRPLPGNHDISAVTRALAAFCDGDRLWEKQLAKKEEAILPEFDGEEIDSSSLHPTHNEAFSINAKPKPIQPKGCFSLVLVMLLLVGIALLASQ